MLTEIGTIAGKAALQELGKKAVNGLIKFLKQNDYFHGNEKAYEIIHEYMDRAYIKYAEMNTIAFQGQSKTIYDLYYPLKLYKGPVECLDSDLLNILREKKQSGTAFEKKHPLYDNDIHYMLGEIIDFLGKKYYDDRLAGLIINSPFTEREFLEIVNCNFNSYTTSYVKEFIEEYFQKVDESFTKRIRDFGNFMIVDSAGMGKSTITRFMAIQAINQSTAIPFIIELRGIDEEHTLWDELYFQLDMYDRHLDLEIIKEQVKSGGFLFIFDGFDEVPDDKKNYVITQIKDFVSKASNNQYIMTSRPEMSLASFGGFKEYNIMPLKETEAFEMISKFGNHNEFSKRLIQCLKEDSLETPTIGEFISNPLMVSLLYRSYQYKNSIPNNKVEFYLQVYNALFEEHDATKDGYKRPKKSLLSRTQFETVLRWMGWFSYTDEKIEYRSHEFYDLVKDSIAQADGINCSQEGFAYDILNSVSLFEDLGNSVKWCHKSFSEYFAARCLHEDAEKDKEYDPKKQFLEEIFKNANSIVKHRNFITFYIEMDRSSCRNYIFIPTFQKIVDEFDQRINWDLFYKIFNKEKVDSSEFVAKLACCKLDKRELKILQLIQDIYKKNFYHSVPLFVFDIYLNENHYLSNLGEYEEYSQCFEDIKFYNENRRSASWNFVMEIRAGLNKKVCEDFLNELKSEQKKRFPLKR